MNWHDIVALVFVISLFAYIVRDIIKTHYQSLSYDDSALYNLCSTCNRRLDIVDCPQCKGKRVDGGVTYTRCMGFGEVLICPQCEKE